MYLGNRKQGPEEKHLWGRNWEERSFVLLVGNRNPIESRQLGAYPDEYCLPGALIEISHRILYFCHNLQLFPVQNIDLQFLRMTLK